MHQVKARLRDEVCRQAFGQSWAAMEGSTSGYQLKPDLTQGEEHNPINSKESGKVEKCGQGEMMKASY